MKKKFGNILIKFVVMMDFKFIKFVFKLVRYKIAVFTYIVHKSLLFTNIAHQAYYLPT